MADEYQEVGDLLLRHATLLATNQDLKEHQRKCAELAEKIRTELQVGPAAFPKAIVPALGCQSLLCMCCRN